MPGFEELLPGIGAEERRRSQQQRHGLHLGVVEYNDDPRNIGRVKIRIAGIHNAEGPDKIPAEKLPWAWPLMQLHSHLVPNVGDTVGVLFWGGNVHQPVWLGKINGNLLNKQIKGRQAYLGDPEPINREERMANQGAFGDPGANNAWSYEQPVGNEAPEETFLKRRTAVPSLQVVVKSPRGHTIYFEDEAGLEAFKIIDRLGQILEFHCPVSEEANRGNMARRVTHEATDGSQVDFGNVAEGGARVTLMDVLNQFLRIESGDRSTIRLQGVKIDGTGNPAADAQINYIEISRSPCEITLRCELKGKIVIDKGINCIDEAGDQLDLHDGVATLSGTGMVQISAPIINLN